MDDDLQTLRKMWPYLTDVGRETVMKFVVASANANGYEEPAFTVFHVQDPKPVKRELLGVDSRRQLRARQVEQELFGPGECPF